MPAVDTPESDGLTFDDLTDLLRVLLDSGDSGLAVVHEVTVFAPDLDENGDRARCLTDAIVASFFSASSLTGGLPTPTT